MAENIGIREYIEKRLNALEPIETAPRQFSPNQWEIFIGVITSERIKKIYHLSKIVLGELEKLSSRRDTAIKDSMKEEIRLTSFDINRLDCVKRMLDAEFEGSLYYEFPKIRDYADYDLGIVVQKDWKVIILKKEMMEAFSEFMIGMEFREKFSGGSSVN